MYLAVHNCTSIYLTVPSSTWLHLALPWSAMIYLSTNYHILPLTGGRNAFVFTGLNAQKRVSTSSIEHHSAVPIIRTLKALNIIILKQLSSVFVTISRSSREKVRYHSLGHAVCTNNTGCMCCVRHSRACDFELALFRHARYN